MLSKCIINGGIEKVFIYSTLIHGWLNETLLAELFSSNFHM